MKLKINNLSIIVAFCFFIGCAGVTEKQKQQASEQLSSDMDYCFSLQTNYTQFAHCINTTSTKYFESVNFPYPEVISLSNSYHLALAERVEVGELTPEQAMRIYMQLRRELLYDSVQREKAAMEQRLAWRELIRSLNSRYLYNYPITCIQTGNIITCN